MQHTGKAWIAARMAAKAAQKALGKGLGDLSGMCIGLIDQLLAAAAELLLASHNIITTKLEPK